MNTYNKMTDEQLATIGKIYYSGKATTYQISKYEAMRAGLLADLITINPQARDTGSALYIQQAITAALWSAKQAKKGA